VLEILEAEQFVAKVGGNIPSPGAPSSASVVALRPDLVKEVAGAGYMVGVILHVDPLPVVAALREAGILTAPAGGVAVRLLPPLNASVGEAGGVGGDPASGSLGGWKAA
jgi:acetylornithine/succinyldiaminopimelate/putrescine aminotransferase